MLALSFRAQSFSAFLPFRMKYMKRRADRCWNIIDYCINSIIAHYTKQVLNERLYLHILSNDLFTFKTNMLQCDQNVQYLWYIAQTLLINSHSFHIHFVERSK